MPSASTSMFFRVSSLIDHEGMGLAIGAEAARRSTMIAKCQALSRIQNQGGLIIAANAREHRAAALPLDVH
jgi:hypothetical protein